MSLPSSSASIPVLDFGAYAHGDTAARADFARRMFAALREFGFFTIENHGIDAGLIRRAYAEVEAFFALPAETKARYEIAGVAGQRGYTSFGKERAKNRALGDLKEFWHVGRDLPAGHALEAVYAPNVWPREVSAFEPTLRELYAALDHTAASLLRALAEGFGMAPETFAAMAVDGDSVLRAIHYPPVPPNTPVGAVRAAEHEDINLLTLLCEGTSGGLEILTREGHWLPVDTLRGQIVVDSGDMLSRVTNGVIPATTHRVVNPVGPNVTRYSMPFFVHPYPECSLDALPATVTRDNPKRHPAITAHGFLAERLREIGLR